MLRPLLLLLMVLVVAVVISSAARSPWERRRRHQHNPRSGRRGHHQRPDTAAMMESVRQQRKNFQERMREIADWPNQRQRHHQQQEAAAHGYPRVAPSFAVRTNADRPKATGFGMMNGLLGRLEHLMEPLSRMDFGDLGLNLDFDFDFDWFKQDKPWWQGENVCESRTEEEEDAAGEIERHQVTTSSICDDNEGSYTCTVSMNVYGKKRTVTVSYTCCYGYERVKGEIGCPKKLKLVDMAETIEKLELGEFLEGVRTVGLGEALATQNLTVFVPTNEAFLKMQPKDTPLSNVVVVSPELMEEAGHLRERILAHLLSGFEPSTQLKDEQVLDAVYPRGTVRINHYNAPVKMTTANCVPVKSLDHLATNGVVHVVEDVLPVVTDSILQQVYRNPQLRTLARLIEETGLREQLQGAGQLTLLAPTDAAFQELQRDTQGYLLQANTCLKKALQSHVLPNVICSSVIQSRGRTLNSLGDYIQLNRTLDDEIYVEGGSRVTEMDLMATNGVVHLIDKVIIPKQVLNIIDMAEELGATSLLALVSKAGLTDTLREMDGFTLFVPSNQAIDSLGEETQAALARDADLLMDVLQYHISVENIASRELYNDRNVDTLLTDKQITVKEYSSFPFSMKTVKTVQCVPMEVTDIESCNARAHVISKVLLPPKGDLLDVVAQDSRFSRFISLLKKAELAETLQLSSYTVFAPTDEAFERVEPMFLKALSDDKDKLKAFLKHHITHDTLCCSGMSIHSTLGWFWKPVEATLDTGSHVVFERNRDNILVDKVPIESCDLTATNGVVHAVSEFLPSAVQKYGASSQQTPVKYQF